MYHAVFFYKLLISPFTVDYTALLVLFAVFAVVFVVEITVC